MRARPHFAAVLVVLALVALGAALAWVPGGAWRGKIAVGGARAYVPRHPVDPDALATIDFERVHAELWPDWVLSASDGHGEAAWQGLVEAVSADPNLVDLLQDVRTLAWDPAKHADGLLRSAWAWNHYLDQQGVPWKLALGIQLASEGAFLYVKTYQIVVDTHVEVAGEPFRARVVARADRTNVIEQWLGTIRDDDGALIVLDRMVTFTLDEVWPLLDPALDGDRLPRERAFAPAVRAAVQRALTAAQVEALRATAADRFGLLEAVDAVHGRHACGSRFVIGRLPYDGLQPRDLTTLSRFAAGTAHTPCPDVTAEEASVFRIRSESLQAREDLRDALEALLAWTTAAIAVHEARHAADHRAGGGRAPVCPSCPAGLSPVGVHELSAYLASVAHPEHGPLALYQACGLAPDDVPVRAEVVSWLTRQLETGCDAPPPADLSERARALEVELFGRADAITLPEDFPGRLPLGRPQ